jgi:ribosome-associated heat shock protein Hsp15
MSLRWDKYLWAVRLSKTRSQATEALNKGRIRVNEQAIKPSRTPQIGDRIQVTKHNATFSYKVLQLLDKRVGAKLVNDYLLDITTEEEREKLKAYVSAQAVYRQWGTGKPTKKDRREIEDFFTDWEDE